MLTPGIEPIVCLYGILKSLGGRTRVKMCYSADLYIKQLLWKCIVTTLGIFINKVHCRDKAIVVKHAVW